MARIASERWSAAIWHNPRSGLVYVCGSIAHWADCLVTQSVRWASCQIAPLQSTPFPVGGHGHRTWAATLLVRKLVWWVQPWGWLPYHTYLHTTTKTPIVWVPTEMLWFWRERGKLRNENNFNFTKKALKYIGVVFHQDSESGLGIEIGHRQSGCQRKPHLTSRANPAVPYLGLTFMNVFDIKKYSSDLPLVGLDSTRWTQPLRRNGLIFFSNVTEAIDSVFKISDSNFRVSSPSPFIYLIGSSSGLYTIYFWRSCNFLALIGVPSLS